MSHFTLESHCEATYLALEASDILSNHAKRKVGKLTGTCTCMQNIIEPRLAVVSLEIKMLL